jgi:hypothetical protein
MSVPAEDQKNILMQSLTEAFAKSAMQVHDKNAEFITYEDVINALLGAAVNVSAMSGAIPLTFQSALRRLDKDVPDLFAAVHAALSAPVFTETLQ